MGLPIGSHYLYTRLFADDVALLASSNWCVALGEVARDEILFSPVKRWIASSANPNKGAEVSWIISHV